MAIKEIAFSKGVAICTTFFGGMDRWNLRHPEPGVGLAAGAAGPRGQGLGFYSKTQRKPGGIRDFASGMRSSTLGPEKNMSLLLVWKASDSCSL